jgi:hypothetical protein
MPITATVTPNFVFKTGMELTAKMLNDVAQPTVEVDDTRITDLENSATGIVDGGRADVQHLEATDIDGGSASI